MADDAFVFELRPAEPPAERERSKRILACAPDVYERVRGQVEASGLGAYFRVVEQPLLVDGQVLIIDPAGLEPPPFEMPRFDFAPQYRCPGCMKPVYMPGRCGLCAEIVKAFPPPRPDLAAIITGMTL